MGPKAEFIQMMKYKDHQDIKIKLIFTPTSRSCTPLPGKIKLHGQGLSFFWRCAFREWHCTFRSGATRTTNNIALFSHWYYAFGQGTSLFRDALCFFSTIPRSIKSPPNSLKPSVNASYTLLQVITPNFLPPCTPKH